MSCISWQPTHDLWSQPLPEHCYSFLSRSALLAVVTDLVFTKSPRTPLQQHSFERSLDQHSLSGANKGGPKKCPSFPVPHLELPFMVLPLGADLERSPSSSLWSTLTSIIDHYTFAIFHRSGVLKYHDQGFSRTGNQIIVQITKYSTTTSERVG